MKRYGLYKKEKLCSATAIDELFGGSTPHFARLSYPLRAVARRNEHRHSDAPVAFLISIPKKRLRHAVDRVLMRRRIREAYRLAHQEYPLEPGVRYDLALIYVSDTTLPYTTVDRAVRRILAALAADSTPASTDPSPSPTAPAL